MKNRRTLLLSSLLAGIIGWLIGYVRVPDISIEHSFWLGVFACLVFICFILLLRLYFNSGSSTSFKNSDKINRGSKYWRLVNYIFLLGACFFVLFFFQQNQFLKKHSTKLEKQINKQSNMLDSIRKSDWLVSMNEVLNTANEEVKLNTNASLSNITITRLADLSYMLQPYHYLESDSLSKRKYSPERAQLLKALLAMEMDSLSFAKLRMQSDFSNADLKKAQLSRICLENAMLKSLDCTSAQLDSISFRKANLQDALFFGADLLQSDFRNAQMKRADFSWANLVEANFQNAELAGANFTSAQLKYANLQAVKMRWGKFTNALLNGANLTTADLTGSIMNNAIFQKANFQNANIRYADFSKADFTGANLKNADLKFSKLSKAILTDAIMDSVIVDIPNWFQQLEEWNVRGVEELKKKYQIVPDTTQKSVYYLERIAN